ncbi:MAG: UDP-N-acetylglucosamine pyrophosphorylase [Lachnospiraceae bacterium]|nr:UDP-N-acetylglucosamine pyrophosphorylase [Lachnospiraceae bacterium]MDD7051050.1 UDP-N-acetylglucosamine pyrophosphorylase [Lachnospiraceae bacterium]MDY3223313.1 UDP-N-acetylglucosamine pyrophosphorylase [Lachnospiraceae bacterium]MDY4096211.1 UDP-N-acetylglucosamine pyrophosphorylase [Lachnospiraceae bacterium]
MKKVMIKDLYNLEETLAAPAFEGCTYPWELLPKIKDYILLIGPTLPEEKFGKKGEDVWIAKSAKIAPTAYINGPCIIDEEAEIRHCAFIRGNAIVGKKAVVGNSTELKNVILFNQVQVPHYNYVGDSILGFKAHMGAGSITSNVKSDKTPVKVHGDLEIETGLKKFGAMLGDGVEVGCNSVLNPGTVIGRNSSIYPVSCVRGVVPEESIYKSSLEISKKY